MLAQFLQELRELAPPLDLRRGRQSGVQPQHASGQPCDATLAVDPKFLACRTDGTADPGDQARVAVSEMNSAVLDGFVLDFPSITVLPMPRGSVKTENKSGAPGPFSMLSAKSFRRTAAYARGRRGETKARSAAATERTLEQPSGRGDHSRKRVHLQT